MRVWLGEAQLLSQAMLELVPFANGASMLRGRAIVEVLWAATAPATSSIAAATRTKCIVDLDAVIVGGVGERCGWGGGRGRVVSVGNLAARTESLGVVRLPSCKLDLKISFFP